MSKLVIFAAWAVTIDPKRMDDPKVLADKYVIAVSDQDHPAGKDYLLGGLNADAVTAMEYQAKIVSRSPPRSEDGSLAEVTKQVAALDAIGVKLMPGATDLSLVVHEDSKMLLAKTAAERKALFKKFPLFADVIRTDRQIYWSPKNPMRAILAASGTSGNYHIDYVLFTVHSVSTDGKQHTWPLRIVRWKTDKSDEGYKVIPASEWDPD